MSSAVLHSDWIKALEELPLVSRIRKNESLKRFNTWRIGGEAACLIDVLNKQDLCTLLPFIQENEIPWFILGKGSNLLVPDEKWPGLILHLSGDFKIWEPSENNQDSADNAEVLAGAGLADVTFVQRCIPNGWGGMEYMIGIPGTIGGAIAMNAGAHGGETASFLKKVEWVDMQGNLHLDAVENLEFRYRFSELNGRLGKVITEAVFELQKTDTETVQQQVQKCKQFRMDKQPYHQPSCGSVFKNPTGDHAARLIEVCGMKGKRIGDAQISPIHSNFIVNLGNAKSADVMALMELAKETVMKNHSVELEAEVQILQYEPIRS